jgi:arylformamidase
MDKYQDRTWIDVSHIIEGGMVHWPEDIEVKTGQTRSIGTHEANVSFVHMSVHTGTHVDAPKHFFKEGKDVSEIPLEQLIGPAKVFHIHNHNCITFREIRHLPIVKGDRVLFKTRNSEANWARQPFMTDYVYLETNAALFLKNRGVICIGVDYLSVSSGNNAEEVHKILLENELLIIEGLNLANIDEGIYDMICLPLKIKDADGSPARVLLKRSDAGMKFQGH